jgi:hypothetical protein
MFRCSVQVTSREKLKERVILVIEALISEMPRHVYRLKPVICHTVKRVQEAVYLTCFVFSMYNFVR